MPIKPMVTGILEDIDYFNIICHNMWVLRFLNRRCRMAQHINIGVACLYGPESNVTNMAYWGFIARECAMNRPNALFLSGGYTRRRTLPGVSEAEVARRTIRYRIGHLLPIHL
jgi:hypothetical protein